MQDVLVTPGQPVAAGAPLVEVGDTPASGLAYRQAADAVTYAKRDLARVQRLYDQQLAANDQLLAAQKALADAQAALAAQAAAGGGHARQAIVSPIAGVVGQVSAARGQQIAAGGALVVAESLSVTVIGNWNSVLPRSSPGGTKRSRRADSCIAYTPCTPDCRIPERAGCQRAFA